MLGIITAMYLQGRNGVENRNGACVMEVASLGSRATMRTKEGGSKKRSPVSSRGGCEYTKEDANDYRRRDTTPLSRDPGLPVGDQRVLGEEPGQRRP